MRVMTEYYAGPICLDELVTVIAQYLADHRWNGWLIPQLDAHAVETVFAAFAAEPETDPRMSTHRWEGDTLVVIEYDGDTEYPTRLEPDEDGLYALGAYSWTWSEDPDYGATEEWLVWAREGRRIWVDASNKSNRSWAPDTPANVRFKGNEDAANAVFTEWREDHPEPQKFPEEDQ